MIAKLRQAAMFMKNDLWRIRARELPPSRRIGLTTLRLVVQSYKEFDKDKCQLRASALTYYTLLSLVPVVAMAFGVAKGFGLDRRLREAIIAQAQGQSYEEAILRILDFSTNMLDSTRGGLVAGAGVIILVYTAIKMLSTIELSLNDVWGVQKSRSFFRRISDFVSILVLFPVVVIAASSANAFLTSQVTAIMAKLEFLGFLAPVITSALRLVPILILMLLLVFLYVAIPNTKVRWASAALGGAVAAIMFVTVQIIYVKFQIGVAKAGAIYGSFAALPLFLVWLQLSWVILLFGAEVAFAHQNIETYELEPAARDLSPATREWLAVAVTRACVERFKTGEPPLTAAQLARQIDLPARLNQELLDWLVAAGVLSEVLTAGSDEKAPAYQPARDLASLRLADVLHLLGRAGGIDLPFANTPDMLALRDRIAALEVELKNSPKNIRLEEVK